MASAKREQRGPSPETVSPGRAFLPHYVVVERNRGDNNPQVEGKPSEPLQGVDPQEETGDDGAHRDQDRSDRPDSELRQGYAAGLQVSIARQGRARYCKDQKQHIKRVLLKEDVVENGGYRPRGPHYDNE